MTPLWPRLGPRHLPPQRPCKQVRSDRLIWPLRGIGQAAPNGAPMSAMKPSASVVAAAAPASNNGAISDEQEFSAVSGRESIESDAQRRATQAAAREQIQPTALPTRPADTGPNIVDYALNAPNQMGQEWYSRSIFGDPSAVSAQLREIHVARCRTARFLGQWWTGARSQGT